MTFYDWMIYRGLSIGSAQNYLGAIKGALSEWAINANLVAGPLTSFTNSAAFDAKANELRALPLFLERNARGHYMYSNALSKFSEYLSNNPASDIESDIDDIANDSSLSVTEALSLIKSRIGQGTFRQKLLLYWQGCAVTGFKDFSLLVASHIKPWEQIKQL